MASRDRDRVHQPIRMMIGAVEKKEVDQVDLKDQSLSQ